MASPLKSYFDRSLGILRRNTGRVLRMDATPNPGPLTLFSFSSEHPPLSSLASFATGSDHDIGGLSTCALTPVPDEHDAGLGQSHVAFHGNLSLRVPAEFQGRIRTGYAAFRNKSRPSFFGEDTWDLELYSHLKIEVAYRGWEAWRSRWVVNLQTDGPVKSDLYQHRLDLPPTTGATPSRAPLDPLHCTGLQFHTLYLPLSSFVLTNSGETSATQIQMMRAKVRTVGFGLLGGGRVDDGATSQAALEAAEKGRRIASGGWGTPGVGESEDPELEELLASDRPAARRPVVAQAQPKRVSGYHRVGDQTRREERSEEADEATPMHAEEGYYELSIKSVQAVKWDPELDE